MGWTLFWSFEILWSAGLRRQGLRPWCLGVWNHNAMKFRRSCDCAWSCLFFWLREWWRLGSYLLWMLLLSLVLVRSCCYCWCSCGWCCCWWGCCSCFSCYCYRCHHVLVDLAAVYKYYWFILKSTPDPRRFWKDFPTTTAFSHRFLHQQHFSDIFCAFPGFSMSLSKNQVQHITPLSAHLLNFSLIYVHMCTKYNVDIMEIYNSTHKCVQYTRYALIDAQCT